MAKFRARQYRDGDGEALNDLYKVVTGHQRSIAEFTWQWLDGPDGPGEMWLIETDGPDGDPLVIGHHGLMPLVFSEGHAVLRAGKTENTMVHPDYRKKLLYPKFERRFLEDYSSRFDLLFSTVGPPAALRQRRALGYDAARRWRNIEIGLGPLAMVPLLASMGGTTRKQSTKRAVATAGLRLGAGVLSALPRFRGPRTGPALKVLSDIDAPKSDFFDDFWTEAATDYPVTPRRSRPDLAWRFWSNPNTTTVTLHTSDPGSVQGYAVINATDPYRFRLDDIVVLPNTAEAMGQLLNSVCDWCAAQGAYALSFMTTDDPGSPGAQIDTLDLPRLETRWPLTRLLPAEGPPMLRKATGRSGHAAAVNTWSLTPFILEGRS